METATKYKIPVTNTGGVSSLAVAEHTLGLTLALTKRIVDGDRFIRQGKFKGWEPMLLLGECLEGKTLGIIGLGRIGSIVAHIARHGFKMKVVYHSEHRNNDVERKCGAKFVSLNELLKKSDIVSLHVPLTKETRHMINHARLGMMKKSAFLINTARGAVVDEKALLNALKSRRIAGAAIDVFEHEPKIAKGLKKLSNIIMTPHIASSALEVRQEMSKVAAQNIIGVLNGSLPKNIVNKEVLKK